jgi:predicted nuclease of predicted toxin-antitoxin system
MLLFDENLSHKLVRALTSDFPGSAHVRHVGLLGGTDEQIWIYARTHGLTIVFKDTDFRERSMAHGTPPKVVWLDVGNAGTTAIAYLLRQERQRIEAFKLEAETSVLVLPIGPRPA